MDLSKLTSGNLYHLLHPQDLRRKSISAYNVYYRGYRQFFPVKDPAFHVSLGVVT